MFHMKSCFIQLLLLATCIVLVNCVLEPGVVGDNYPDNLDLKNADDANAMAKRPSFFVGSRYGRSGGAARSPLFSPSKARRLNVVPRADRFFLGSRYGKRTAAYLTPSLEGYEHDVAAAAETRAATLPNEPVAMNTKSEMNTEFMMSCIYTGVKNLYRCNSIDEINNIINQLTGGPNDEDRK